jgi:hypothetical protein
VWRYDVSANASTKMEGRVRRIRWLRAAVAWGPLVAYSGAIFLVSSGSLPETLRPDFLTFLGADKVGHLGIYAMWGGLAAWAHRRSWPAASTRGAVLFSWIGGTLYGLSDEIHQVWVPGRAAEAGDLIADSLGAFLGAVVVCSLSGMLFRRRRERPDET